MDTKLTFLLLCTLLNWPPYVVSSISDSYLVTVENVQFRGLERFPDNVDIVLGNQGNKIYLKLTRDDQSTNILSEELFDASKLLPNGVFDEDKRDNFAAYNAGPSDMIILHRETNDDKPKLYGRFTNQNEQMLIQPDSGTNVYHRLRRYVKNEHTRVRRAVSNDKILEVFVFADLSVFEHIRDEFMPANATGKQTKRFIRDYINGVIKEVDSIFKKMGEDYGANNTFRVYFQQYQIITKSEQQEWLNTKLTNGNLNKQFPDSLKSYYESLITKYAFPDTDLIVHLTRLNMVSQRDALFTSNVLCDDIPVAAARIASYPTSVAKSIASSLGVSVDGDGNDCSPDDQYIMNTLVATGNVNSTYQGNRWKFSNCSAQSLIKLLETDPACLKTEDVIFNLERFDKSPTINKLLSLDQQCQILFDTNSTFADESAVDCYSDAQQCVVSGMMNSIDVPQGTSCNKGKDTVCEYGFCVDNSTGPTTLTDLQTTTVTPSSTTGSPCVIETGFVEFDLPGCGCCGGCGCDGTCSSCDPGVPAYNQSKSCTKDKNCCGSKVKMTTLFVPDGCDLTYIQGPRTLVMEKRGWENTDSEVTAEVYQDAFQRWQVNLVPRS